MKTKAKSLLLIIALVAVASCVALFAWDRSDEWLSAFSSRPSTSGPWPSIDASLLKGEFVRNRYYEGDILDLSTDGEFTYRFSSCMQGHTCEGGLSYENGRLRFLPKAGHTPDGLARTTTCPFSQGRFELLPIRWDERVYLVEPDRVLEFCNRVNLGDEPVRETYGHYFYIRRDDHKKAAKRAPVLPREWSRYILSKPVSCKVTRQREYKLTLDAGDQDGLQPGMLLVSNCSSELSPDATSYTEIVSVGQSESRAEVRHGCWPTPGNAISTRKTPSQ